MAWTTSPPPWAVAAGLVALGAALYLPGLGAEILRHPLEAKYALAAREMLHGGPWLVAHLFGTLYPDKPPLYFWATAGLSWLAGGEVRELHARLPAAGAAVATLLLTWRLGTALFGAGAGVWAGLTLATSNLFFWYARQGHPDQFLTAAVTLAGLAFWHVLTAAGSRPPVPWIVVAYAALGLGVLSKGLLGLVLPLLGATAYAALTGRPGRLAVRLGLPWGLPVFLALTLAWFVPAVVRHGTGYLYEAVVRQHLVRYARTWAHAAPWYYYLGEFPAGFSPWVVFLPGALVLAWRWRGAGRAEAAGTTAAAAGPGGDPARPWLYPWLWFVTGFLLFSLASGKRGVYLLPLYPAAAVLVGACVHGALTGRIRRAWVGVPLAVVGGAGAALALALPLVPRRLLPGTMVDTLVPASRGALWGVTGLVLAAAAAVAGAWRRGRPGLALGLLAGVQGGLLLVAAAVRAPQYEARYPARAFARELAAHVPAGERILSLVGDYSFLVAFYAGRPLVPLAGPSELLEARAPGRPVYALLGPDDGRFLAAPGTAILAQMPLGPRRVFLVRLSAP